MEELTTFKILSLLAKRNLLKAFMTWKSRADQTTIGEKYKKLKSYLAKVLKNRQIPEIKIQTVGNTKSTGKLFREISNNLSSSRVYISRSNSSLKNSTGKPPNGFEKSGKEGIENISQKKQFASSSKLPICKRSEEVAVVSSSSLLSELRTCSGFLGKS